MLKPILFMISETSLATLPGACSHQGVFPIPFYTMHSSTVKEKNQSYKPAYNRLVVERVESISQLAAVDGALILNSELDVITWGATLRAASWTRKVLIGPDGRGVCTGERFERERFGTRHNSAIDFAGSHPGSVVFVASQDGPGLAPFLWTLTT